MFSFLSPLMVGSIILVITFCMKDSLAKGTGEIAPIPPVFKPVSPTPIRL